MHIRRPLILLTALALLGALALGRPAPASAAPQARTFTVNLTLDAVDYLPGDGVCETGAGNGLCTLRAAIMEANAWIGADTITLPAETYTLTIPGTDEDASATGDLDLTHSLTLTGAGAADTIIQWTQFAPEASRDRVIEVLGQITVKISGVTVRYGYVAGQPSGGGLLLIGGDLTISDSRFFENETDAFGGGLESFGALTIERTVFDHNHAYSAGGLYSGGPLTITDSLIVDNYAQQYGGGLTTNGGPARISGTTIRDNRAGYGGGLSSDGYVTMLNSTLSGNVALLSAGYGGGILNSREMTLTNTTVSGNQAKTSGGGIYSAYSSYTALWLYNATVVGNTTDSDHDGTGDGGGLFVGSSATATLSNSLVALNFDGTAQLPALQTPDCKGTVRSLGYNLLGNSTGCLGLTPNQNGDQVGTYYFPVAPLLGALGDHGGATLTHALDPASPAVNAGNPAGCADSLGETLTVDQRGYVRPTAGRCDIGAFEYAVAPLVRIFIPFVRR